MSDLRGGDSLEPLAFAILARLTPPDVELRLIDERLEPIPYDHATDLVALTVETYTARHAYQIAARFRSRGVPVVMGGYHPTFLPQEALRFADAVVAGDAEGLWEGVVADARAGRLRGIYRQSPEPALGGLVADRTIFRGHRYPPMRLVQTSRGCRYACEFCSIHAFYGTSLRRRPVAEVAAEIAALGRPHVFFVDDNIFVDVPAAQELFQALVPLGIRWSCQVSIDVAHDGRLLDLMARSGCISALIGFESLDVANLKQMRKPWNLRYGDYASAVRAFRERGIMIHGQFVFGYDSDTVESFDRAVDFSLESRLAFAGFNTLTPTPGTALYERLRRERRLLFDRWWLDPGYRWGDATFRPQRMTPDELTEGCAKARARFHSYLSIAARALDSQANARRPYNLAIFVAGNVIARRELARKRGLRLGDGTPLPELAADVDVRPGVPETVP
jgi:radical SAM superfamily enzyme YgiQ (UPF0313 family)